MVNAPNKTTLDIVDAIRANTRELVERTQAVAYLCTDTHCTGERFTAALDARDAAHRDHHRLLAMLEAQIGVEKCGAAIAAVADCQKSYDRTVGAALNSGDGSYKP